MNNLIILMLFLGIWTIFYFISLLIIDINYIKVKKVSIKQINNIYANDKKLFIKFEAKLDFNKTCHIDILNSKMIENIIYNIENDNYKYFTIIKANNLCEKPKTFKVIVFEKILFHLFLIFISLLLCFILINLFFDKIDNCHNGYIFFELMNNYKKDDNIIKESKINNNSIDNKYNNDELNDYDIIEKQFN